jgi:hypothetical protein
VWIKRCRRICSARTPRIVSWWRCWPSCTHPASPTSCSRASSCWIRGYGTLSSRLAYPFENRRREDKQIADRVCGFFGQGHKLLYHRRCPKTEDGGEPWTWIPSLWSSIASWTSLWASRCPTAKGYALVDPLLEDLEALTMEVVGAYLGINTTRGSTPISAGTTPSGSPRCNSGLHK